MNRKSRCSLAFALLLFASLTTSYAQIKDVDDLAKGVTLYLRSVEGDKSFDKDEESLKAIINSMSYLEGFRDCAISVAVLSNPPPMLLPDGKLELTQFARIVRKYVSDHPDRTHEGPGIVVWNALLDSFPNRNYKPPKQPTAE